MSTEIMSYLFIKIKIASSVRAEMYMRQYLGYSEYYWTYIYMYHRKKNKK